MNGEGSGRYLAFELGGELYAVEVERVEVVLETVPITRVPKAPPHLRGVINYRGSVIPVADLRSRFGTAKPSSMDTDGEGKTRPVEDTGTNIIVLNIRYGGGDITIGMLADMVREVVDLDPSRIERAPTLGSRGQGGLIAGVGEKDGRFIVLLDVDAAFAADIENTSDHRIASRNAAIGNGEER